MLDLFSDIVGAGATFFIGFWLAKNPKYESRRWIRYPEIGVSWLASALLFVRACMAVLGL